MNGFCGVVCIAIWKGWRFELYAQAYGLGHTRVKESGGSDGSDSIDDRKGKSL